ncbi:hypothetical protein B0H11DRAFT_2304387 [Mycena galericulata]|nr:hypothetical protein B0H11DRAFT_2304387 [Mycena galericulata]
MPNHVEVNIVNEILEYIKQPAYTVNLSWLRGETWKSVRSRVNTIREGLRIKGRGSIKYAFMLAFLNVTGGLEDGLEPGVFGTLENCILSERVLFAVLKKVRRGKFHLHLRDGENVSAAFHVFVGGMWDDVCGLNKVVPCLARLFEPLIQVGMAARSQIRPFKKAKCGDGSDQPRAAELDLLERMWQFQEKTKPQKLPKTGPKLFSSPSVSDDEEMEDDAGEGEGEGEQDDKTNFIVPSSASLNPAVFPGDASAALATTTLFWSGQPLGSLLEPFSLRGEPASDSKGRPADAGPEFTLLPRSPLTPRNRPDHPSRSANPQSHLSLFSGDSPAGWRYPPAAAFPPPISPSADGHARPRPQVGVSSRDGATIRAPSPFSGDTPAGWRPPPRTLRPLEGQPGPSHNSALPRGAKRPRNSLSPGNHNDGMSTTAPKEFFSSTGYINSFSRESPAKSRKSLL